MTRQEIDKLREQRAALVKQAREIMERAEGEGRSLDAAEREQYDKVFEDIGGLKTRVEDAEKVLAEERDLAEKQPRKVKPEIRTTPPSMGSDDEPPGPEVRTVNPNGDREFRYHIRPDRLAPLRERIFSYNETRSSGAYQTSFRRYLQNKVVDQRLSEQRDLQADSQTGGGGVVPSEQFIAELVKFVDDAVFIRSLATVIQVGRADSLGAPAYDADPGDADWTSEVPSALTADTTMAFGKRELHPWQVTKLVKASRKILRVSAINLEQFVRERLGYKLAITHEKGFLTGSGANQPLGVFTASSLGISTSRDVSTGNSTTGIGADNLREVKYSLKSQYRMRGTTRWMFHRDAVKEISKLKDADGQYLWRPGISSNDPDSLLGFPLMESEFAPNTFTTGLYVGILGDWSQYWIADSLDMEILRLDERYSDTLQVGFQLMAASDGMPVIEEAFARVTLA